MFYRAKEHELKLQNYITMERYEFERFVIKYELAVFIDDNMEFTYYNGIQVVLKVI